MEGLSGSLGAKIQNGNFWSKIAIFFRSAVRKKFQNWSKNKKFRFLAILFGNQVVKLGTVFGGRIRQFEGKNSKLNFLVKNSNFAQVRGEAKIPKLVQK